MPKKIKQESYDYIYEQLAKNPDIRAKDLHQQMSAIDRFKDVPSIPTIRTILINRHNSLMSDPSVEPVAEPVMSASQEPAPASNPTAMLIAEAVKDPEVLNAIAPVLKEVVEKIVDAKINNLIQEATNPNNQSQQVNPASGSPPQADKTSDGSLVSAEGSPLPSETPVGNGIVNNQILQQLLPVLLQGLMPKQQTNPMDSLTSILPQFMGMAQSINQMFLAPFLSGMEVSNNMSAQSFKMGSEPQNIVSGTASAIESIKNGAMYGQTNIQDPPEQKTG